MSARGIAGLAAAAVLVAPAAAGAAKAPPPLSLDSSRVAIRSDHGSGVFGKWGIDRLGMPAYRYDLDHRERPEARQPELNGRAEAWHQLGNDHIVANAYNRGYVQLWSQDRIYQWVNLADPANGHYGGGFGWLRIGDRTYPTLYDDLPASAGVLRRFGSGYYERITPAGPVRVRERVYAPFGDDPILLHDVVLRNTTREPLDASWFEYWGVNPVQQLPALRLSRGLGRPAYDSESQTLTVDQQDPLDADPLTIYAAALNAPVSGFETSVSSFFGEGGRANPAAVRADRMTGSIAPASLHGLTGSSLFALRSQVRIPPRGRVVLRYAYGAAQREQVPGLVARYRAAQDPFAASARSWRRWLPQIRLGRGREWLSRELQWDAYMLRSGTTFEEGCGHHVISQGGFYQYSLGFQGAYRDPLQHMLPMIYAAPWLAREVLRYSSRQQPRSGFIPYAHFGMCQRFDFGSSNDLDLWLMLAAAEYGLASRDMDFFDERIPFADGGDATIWEHLKLALRHQESQRGLNGGYLMGLTGDWSDFSTQLGPMTESILVTAQAAYVYRRLAELATARGDAGFAQELTAKADELRRELDDQWAPGGWYTRGYLATLPVGRGVIYGEPQPWALLAGAADPGQAIRLVANIRRFLTGVGAPAEAKGPALIGSSQSPARSDPDVQERGPVGGGVGNQNAVFVGGVWYAVNGWLTWALAEQDGTVPNARTYAFDEFLRNTLAAHATAFPRHWNGVISVDDACRSHYDPEPARCGVGLSTSYDGQIMHQPAWSLFGAIKLAGIVPTAGGYRIEPHLPLGRFRLSLDSVGLARERGRLRGYVRAERDGAITLEVRPPVARKLQVWVGGRRVRARREGGLVSFALPLSAGRAADWAITYSRRRHAAGA